MKEIYITMPLKIYMYAGFVIDEDYMRKNPRWKLYMNDFTDILTRIHDIATRFDGVGHVK